MNTTSTWEVSGASTLRMDAARSTSIGSWPEQNTVRPLPRRDESLDDSDELPEPQDLAAEAITQLDSVVDDLKEIITLLEKEEGVDK